jgi:hypothetical protein
MTIPRYLLEKHFAGDVRMIRALEEQSETVDNGVAATSALADATVIVLSANGDFTNERVLEVGDGIAIEVTDDTVKLSVENVALTLGGLVTLIAEGPTRLSLPIEGRVLSSIQPMIDVSALGTYADDSVAATGGVAVGEPYINGSGRLDWRVS